MKKVGISIDPDGTKELTISISNSLIQRIGYNDINKLAEELTVNLINQIIDWKMKMMLKN